MATDIFFYPHDSRKAGKSILLLAWFADNTPSTVLENVFEFQKFSNNRVDVINTLYLNADTAKTVDLSKYQAVMAHCSTTYNLSHIKTICSVLKMDSYAGNFIVAKQDESRNINALIEFLDEMQVDLLLTCIPDNEIQKVYPKARLPRLRFLNTLTGYVTDEMRQRASPLLAERKIDVSYRGSLQPHCFGQLCYEKRWIAEAFSHAAQHTNLVCDISNKWEDRIFGDAWINFLNNSRAVLGVESGASVFDFDGSIERNCVEYEQTHPDCTFHDVQKRFLLEHEGNVYYNQISPRHFEAAASKCVQILLEGHYSGIFEAGRHYISLKRDFSNFDDVIKQLQDVPSCQQMVQRAYDEIILNDTWNYKTYVHTIDKAIDALPPPPVRICKPHVLVVLFWHLSKDPRVLREVLELKKRFKVSVAAFDDANLATGCFYDICHLPHARCGLSKQAALGYPSGLITFLKFILPKSLLLKICACLNKNIPSHMDLSGPGINLAQDHGVKFKELCADAFPFLHACCLFVRHMITGQSNSLRKQGKRAALRIFANLYKFAAKMQHTSAYKLKYNITPEAFNPVTPYDAVVAIDVQTLPLAFELAKGAPVVFDCHEHFPTEYDEDPKWRFWHKAHVNKLGAKYMPRCARTVTVSNGLAKEFAVRYSIPEPAVVYSGPPYEDLPVRPVSDDHIRLVYHGRAHSGRHIENMIKAMDYADKRFTLDLVLAHRRSQDDGYLDALVSARKNVRISPPFAMEEISQRTNELYDIGLFILAPSSYSYKHAMPNKFFEFIQARLAIAIGPSPDMSEMVRQYDLGIVSDDFTPQSMASKLNALTTADIMRFKQNADKAARVLNANNNMAKFCRLVESAIKH